MLISPAAQASVAVKNLIFDLRATQPRSLGSLLKRFLRQVSRTGA
jgi:hypothetical protein